MRISSKKILLAYAVPIVVVAFTIHNLTSRPPSMEAASRNFLTALREGDGRSLYDYTLPAERELYRLTPAKMELFVNEFVKPRISRFHANGPVKAIQVPGGAQAQVFQDLVDERGRPFEFAVHPIATPDGAKEKIGTILNLVWYMEYLVQRGSPRTHDNTLRAYIEGIRHDRQRLIELGFAGYASSAGSDPTAEQLYEWDEAQKSLQSMLDKYPKDQIKRM